VIVSTSSDGTIIMIAIYSNPGVESTVAYNALKEAIDKGLIQNITGVPISSVKNVPAYKLNNSVTNEKMIAVIVGAIICGLLLVTIIIAIIYVKKRAPSRPRARSYVMEMK